MHHGEITEMERHVRLYSGTVCSSYVTYPSTSPYNIGLRS
uniref:Uncharacterized protein n=1 Tax=Anguilla anguilla TaxID=7936 RepID=A0A0E9SG55_ANGAN